MIESLGNWSVIAIFAVCPIVPRTRADLSRNHLGSLAKCARLTAKCAFEFRVGNPNLEYAAYDMLYQNCCFIY